MGMETRKKLQNIVAGTLEQIQHTAENYAEATGGAGRSHGNKRRLAAVTTASLISAGLDRVTEISTDEEDAMQDLTKEERKLAKQNHFIDILLEKLIQNAIPDHVPDKSEFYDRVNDPLRKQSENLSVSKFARNLTQLTSKIGGIFQTQYFLLKIFNWSDPSLTLTALIIYTILILHPNLFMILPLIFLLYGAMVPGYLYRHPIANKLNNMVPTKDRGDSLIEKFARVKDEKKLDEMIEEEKVVEIIPEVENKTDTSSHILKSQMEFLINMRDLQNLMTNLLKASDNLENFWYGTAGFKDERASTSLFSTVFLTAFMLLISDPFINWKIVFIILGWVLLIVIHPKILPNIKKFNEVVIQPQNKKLNKMVKESERNDLIMDESPEIRQVEVFEIYTKSSSNVWEFFLFSSHIFDPPDEYRRCQKPPPGVSTLDEVTCPKTWRFQDPHWHTDYECNNWVTNRNLNLNEMFIDEEFLIDDQFKRRRLFRNVIRYSKPARKPPHLL